MSFLNGIKEGFLFMNWHVIGVSIGIIFGFSLIVFSIIFLIYMLVKLADYFNL